MKSNSLHHYSQLPPKTSKPRTHTSNLNHPLPIKEFSAGGIVFRSSPKTGYKFILIKDGYGNWTFPKGRIEPGESPEAAALAEVEEEAGVRDPHIIGKLGEVILTLHPKDARSYRKKVFFFLIKTRYTTVEKEYKKPSVQDARWFTKEEAMNALRYANMKLLFSKALKMLKKIE